jgi:hypothetical protein
MSAGLFLRSRYQADYDGGTTTIHPIRVQPETLEFNSGLLDNDPPAGAVTNPISAVVSLGKRQKGLRPRTVTIEVFGTAPSGYSATSRTTIPILTSTVFTSIAVGSTVTYLAANWQVISKSPETVS